MYSCSSHDSPVGVDLRAIRGRERIPPSVLPVGSHRREVPTDAVPSAISHSPRDSAAIQRFAGRPWRSDGRSNDRQLTSMMRGSLSRRHGAGVLLGPGQCPRRTRDWSRPPPILRRPAQVNRPGDRPSWNRTHDRSGTVSVRMTVAPVPVVARTRTMTSSASRSSIVRVTAGSVRPTAMVRQLSPASSLIWTM